MPETISPARRLQGNIRLPGDKSISHRYGIIAALAEGTSKIHHYSTGADPESTLGCMRALGAKVERIEGTVLITGCGLDGLTEPTGMLDAGNSGSTIRMLAGILAAQKFTSRIAGDDSLAKRPMKRIMEPLAKMGGQIEARDGTYPPLVFHPLQPHTALKAIRYEPPMASAQVKTCVLLAGLFADGPTTVVERIKTRDHTELALAQFGAEIETLVVNGAREITIQGRPKLVAQELEVPGDLSSAAFFLVAASLVPGSDLRLEGVGLNPSRTGLLDWLSIAGAKIKIIQVAQSNGEIIGTLGAQYAPQLKGGVIEGAVTAALIDEIPVLAILGAASSGGLTVRDAKELRVKETDRIATIAEGLLRMGVRVEVFEDGFHIPGGQKFKGAQVDSHHDHRIAMAFAVAGLIAEGNTTIENSEAASVSFPEFYSMLKQIAQ